MDIVKVFIFLAAVATVCQSIMPFKTQCLYWHNYFRKLHQVGPVTWSEDLRVEAENWAKYLAENNKFHHSKKNPGNLYLSGYKPKEYCSDAVKWFHAEVKYYDFNKPGYKEAAGHFTQVVWKNTKQIGAAWAIRKDGRLVVVIKYRPGGNYVGYFAKNVFPALKSTTQTPLSKASTTKPEAKAAARIVASSFGLIFGFFLLASYIY